MTGALDKARWHVVALRPACREDGRVHLELDGDRATIWIDNGGARNALTVGMMEDLLGAVEVLRGWGGSTVVLRARGGGAFCAGGHLGQVRKGLGTPDAGRRMARVMGPVLDALYNLPMVSVALVEGPAVGGGAELATACDHRIFTEEAWFQFRQAALGVGAGWGGIRRLVHQVPATVALRWVTTARRVDGREATAMGFSEVCVAAGHGDEALEAFLAPVRALPVAGVRAVKRQVAAARGLSEDRTEDVEAFSEVWGGPAHRAAMGMGDG